MMVMYCAHNRKTFLLRRFQYDSCRRSGSSSDMFTSLGCAILNDIFDNGLYSYVKVAPPVEEQLNYKNRRDRLALPICLSILHLC